MPLWVDAKCINQSSLYERVSQVPLMRQIYNQAEMVYIWLGEAIASTEAGIGLLQQACTAIQRLSRDTVNKGQYPTLMDMGLPQTFDPSWQAAAEIASRPWFTRVWAIQEIVVARRCMFLCGRFKLHLELFKTLA